MKTSIKPTSKQEPDLSYVHDLLQTAKDASEKSNRKRNLELLWSVLESIRADGSRDFSIAEVGRRMESAGGMRTQSLRNTGTEEFRRIIAEYSEAVRIKGSFQPIPGGDTAKRALELVTDPLAKSVLEGYVREAKRLREENNMLRAAFRQVQLPVTLPEEPRMPVLQDVQMIDRELFKILQKALSNKMIKRWGVIQADGSIQDIQGYEVFPSRFIEAAEAALKVLSH